MSKDEIARQIVNTVAMLDSAQVNLMNVGNILPPDDRVEAVAEFLRLNDRMNALADEFEATDA
jgi:uncharacterized protein (DUF4213/DUF364 family)